MDIITQARFDLLNSVMRVLPDLLDRRGVTLVMVDSVTVERLRAVDTRPRTLPH